MEILPHIEDRSPPRLCMVRPFSRKAKEKAPVNSDDEVIEEVVDEVKEIGEEGHLISLLSERSQQIGWRDMWAFVAIKGPSPSNKATAGAASGDRKGAYASGMLGK